MPRGISTGGYQRRTLAVLDASGSKTETRKETLGREVRGVWEVSRCVAARGTFYGGLNFLGNR